MIPSYREEIRIRRNKDRVFWAVVAVMTVFLYFFFQGYYPNYERIFDRQDTSRQAFLKPFGIIDIHVFPSPDAIWINNEYYNNNSKTIFDLGEYMVSVQKKDYLPITFLIDITKRNPFYTNVVNLFNTPRYSSLPFAFRNLSLYNDMYILHSTQTGVFLFVDREFQVLHSLRTVYRHIGGLYFTDGNNVLSYSLDTEKFVPVIARETGLPLQCPSISYYGEKLFCHDTMRFEGAKISDIREKILAINDSIVVTPKYIYNQDSANGSWRYYQYQTGSLRSPDSLVHINKIPYLFTKGILSPLDKIDRAASLQKKPDWGMDTISQAQDFDNETLLLWQKQWHGAFRIMDTDKVYTGTFDFENTADVKVRKVSGAYVFTTPKAAYIYYKGAKEIMKILDGVDIIGMVEAEIFFNKEGKSYMVDLLWKEEK